MDQMVNQKGKDEGVDRGDADDKNDCPQPHK